MGNIIIWIVIIAVLTFGIYYFVYRPKTVIPKANTPTPSVGFNGSTAVVDIRNFAFNPQQITVKNGDKVRWTNNDFVAHKITSDTGIFVSEIIDTGKFFEFIFTSVGEFPYHCAIHPSMTGKIIVE